MYSRIDASVGFLVSGFGFRVQGFGFRVSGFGFRVSGFGFDVQPEARSRMPCTPESPVACRTRATRKTVNLLAADVTEGFKIS